MGYGVHRFIGPIDPNLICGICSSVLEDAVLTPCGHTFCLSCLNTWLRKPATNTCPECRSPMSYDDAKPVLALRNLINGFEVECENNPRGCKVIVKLDRLKTHMDTCGYYAVDCAGCGGTMNRYELASHQMNCEGITTAVQDVEEQNELVKRLGSLRINTSITAAEVSDLLCKISSLEYQVKNLKRDLQISESKNRVLEREYRKTKDELLENKNELLDIQYSEFDPEYDYGYTPQSVAKLSLLIARFLLKKPNYIDRDKIFHSVKRSYDEYARCGTEYEHDVHMLLATSFASNWFSESQRINLHCWLQGIARHRKYATEFNLHTSENNRRYYQK